MGLAFLASTLTPATAQNWKQTTSMTAARFTHTATLLPSGKVLVTGGHSSPLSVANIVATSDLYDPSTATWTSAGTMGSVRWMHTATLLLNGKVLVAGGDNATADLYDPALGTWSRATSMSSARRSHGATLLPSGKVLVSGGFSGSGLSSAETYDPATGTWLNSGAMNATRCYHTATLLPGGKVLVAGGYSGSGSTILSSADLYDPASGAWTRTGSMTTTRQLHTATLLPNGRVLVAGGTGDLSGKPSRATAEIYDPSTGIWTSTATMSVERIQHTSTLLPNGKVLVTGGFNGLTRLATTETYDASSGAWSVAGPMTTARVIHTATLLPNGKVLVAGGEDGINCHASAELSLIPAVLNIRTAVFLDSTTLEVGTSYQIQTSTNLLNWANYGAPFTATNSSWESSDIWKANRTGQLHFRLQQQ